MSFLNKILCGVAIPCIFISCTSGHLVSDKNYRLQIDKAFLERKNLAINRSSELFSVFKKELTPQQSEALKFLFAYMPLSDLADYTGEFFLANINKSLQARELVTWGETIPEDIFLHYILPCRVNNENLDSFRISYFNEIHERIKRKNLVDAALEINYWCHEKVAYQPADIRTSSPMSTILCARGRCGEESTFTVAALRTAGIPARQVYTPRWAHIDDNHAWVEVWIDGEWHYMGACEPEPVLDRGWFTDYASRAMLVHTKSFGAQYGNENIINIHRNYTEVNNLAKYAKTKRVYIRVLESGKPAEGAKVDYCIYNYAEFYPVTSVPADQNGISSLETGFGDLVIWASKEGKFDWKKISVQETDTVELNLGASTGKELTIDLDISAPPELAPFPGIPEELMKQNAVKIENGNFIRQSYLDSWIKDDEIKMLSEKLRTDHGRVKAVLQRSMGNYEEITNFLINSPDSLISRALDLLGILPEKDLRDAKSSILSDHLLNTTKNNSHSDEFFTSYVLNSRVANEMMLPWRSYFLKNLPDDLLKKGFEDPQLLTDHLNSEIVISEVENYYKTPITPIGVYKLKVSDEQSRAVCFVAMCRSLGVPSRLEPGRNIPQYWKNEKWNDVYFADQDGAVEEKGTIRFVTDQDYPVPQYSTHFTLALFREGRYHTLEYDFNLKVTEFPDLELPAGDYMLVTGNRPDKNVIYAKLSFFSLDNDEEKRIVVNLRPAQTASEYDGTVNIKEIRELLPRSLTQETDFNKGFVLAWIDPDQEPTRHVFTDLPPVKKELDEWGGLFIFMTGSKAGKTFFDHEKLIGLPYHSVFTNDPSFEKLKSSVKLSPPPDIRLPFIVLADKSGKVKFVSSGYRIGIGEQLIRHLK